MNRYTALIVVLLLGVLASIALGNGIQPINPTPTNTQVQPAPQPQQQVQVILIPTRRGGFMPYYIVPVKLQAQPILVPAHGSTRTGGLRGVVFGDVFRW